jgi:hypothetical protein
MSRSVLYVGVTDPDLLLILWFVQYYFLLGILDMVQKNETWMCRLQCSTTVWDAYPCCCTTYCSRTLIRSERREHIQHGNYCAGHKKVYVTYSSKRTVLGTWYQTTRSTLGYQYPVLLYSWYGYQVQCNSRTYVLRIQNSP